MKRLIVIFTFVFLLFLREQHKLDVMSGTIVVLALWFATERVPVPGYPVITDGIGGAINISGFPVTGTKTYTTYYCVGL